MVTELDVRAGRASRRWRSTTPGAPLPQLAEVQRKLDSLEARSASGSAR